MPSEESCANCHRMIGALEQAFVWKDNIVCSECHRRLSTKALDKPAESGKARGTKWLRFYTYIDGKARGTKWLRFYTYITIPLNILLWFYLFLPIILNQRDKTHILLLILYVYTFVGLIKRKSWGWWANWFVLFINSFVLVPDGLSSFITYSPFYFPVTLLWFFPNAIYFRRRTYLFIPEEEH